MNAAHSNQNNDLIQHNMSFSMMYLRTNRGYGVYTGGHPQTVSMTQLLPFPPVEADPGRVPAVRRHRDLQLHPGRHHDRPEVTLD